MPPSKPIKQKRCLVCRALYTPKRIGLKVTKVCLEPKCVLEHKKILDQKEFNRETRRRKDAFNDRDLSWWAKKVEKKCNEYIRLRDQGKPCISCGNTNTHIKYDAGHFIPVGRSLALRYEPTNIHLQCSKNCNTGKSGNYGPYRQALVKLYGEDHVLWLEKEHPLPRRRKEDYKELYKKFTQLIKYLSSN